VTQDERPDPDADDTSVSTWGTPPRTGDETSLLRPQQPPAYPGYGEPGWFGHESGPQPTTGLATGAPGQTTQPMAHPAPQPFMQHPGVVPGGYPGQQQPYPQTPWVAIGLVTLVIGLLGGILGAVSVVALDQDEGSRSATSQVEPLGKDPAPLAAGNVSVTRVADSVLPSVVQIRVQGGAEGATGSGFVLDTDGRVVTNAHVVEPAVEEGQISVVLPGGNERAAELVGRSEAYDLAVLEIAPDGLEPARLGASDVLRVGQTVVAFGSPLGLTSTVTSGIVSALDRPVTTGGGDASSFINAIQTDAAINPGNSGGPLVDLQGRVVGVNSAIATVGSALGGQAGNIGVGFAIPIDQVRLTAEQIIQTGKAVYPVIGATVQTAEGADAVVREVSENSPAEEAGLRRGDIVRRIDGEPVLDGIELIVTIRSYQPGDTIEVEYDRDGEQLVANVVLGEQEG